MQVATAELPQATRRSEATRRRTGTPRAVTSLTTVKFVSTVLGMTSGSLRDAFRRHVREQVLIAARALTVEKGWERVRISEIASLVGVSRPTIYKEFGDKAGLGDAIVLQEAERFLAGIATVLENNVGDAGAAITAAVRFTFDEAERSPLLKAVLVSNRAENQPHAEPTGVLPLLPTSRSMLQTASQTLTAWFCDHFVQLDAEDVADGIDALVRLTVSHLVLPGGDPTQVSRRVCVVALRYLGLPDPA